jgi:hypothetical protein
MLALPRRFEVGGVMETPVPHRRQVSSIVVSAAFSAGRKD